MAARKVRKRVKNLNTVDGVRMEMARVYREARYEDIDVKQAGSLVFILKTISSLIVDIELEKRVETLEAAAEGRGQSSNQGIGKGNAEASRANLKH